jgi:hypothetical protein
MTFAADVATAGSLPFVGVLTLVKSGHVEALFAVTAAPARCASSSLGVGDAQWVALKHVT